METNEYSFCQELVDFLTKAMKDHPDMFRVERISKRESVIIYEDYTEHPPIINHDSVAAKFRESKRAYTLKGKNNNKGKYPRTPEQLAKISESMKKHVKTPEHIAKITASRIEYYKNKRKEKENNEKKDS